MRYFDIPQPAFRRMATNDVVEADDGLNLTDQEFDRWECLNETFTEEEVSVVFRSLILLLACHDIGATSETCCLSLPSTSWLVQAELVMVGYITEDQSENMTANWASYGGRGAPRCFADVVDGMEAFVRRTAPDQPWLVRVSCIRCVPKEQVTAVRWVRIREVFSQLPEAAAHDGATLWRVWEELQAEERERQVHFPLDMEEACGGWEKAGITADVYVTTTTAAHVRQQGFDMIPDAPAATIPAVDAAVEHEVVAGTSPTSSAELDAIIAKLDEDLI